MHMLPSICELIRPSTRRITFDQFFVTSASDQGNGINPSMAPLATLIWEFTAAQRLDVAQEKNFLIGWFSLFFYSNFKEKGSILISGKILINFSVFCYLLL